MPIPAPSTSSKSRLQVSKANKASLQPKSSQTSILDDESDMKLTEATHSMIRPSLDRPLSLKGNVEGTKRRSLLPQPGHARYSSRSSMLATALDRNVETNEPSASTTVSPELTHSVSVTKEVNVQSATPRRLRPRSTYQTGVASPERKGYVEETSASQEIRPPASMDKPFEPQTAGLGRSQSLRKPGVSVQSAPSTGTTLHSRAQSVSTTTSTRRDTAKPKASSERPKSLLVAPGSTLKTGGVPADRVPNGARASARLAGLNRSVSTRAKPEILSSDASNGTARRAEDPQSKQREPIREELKKTSRPAFTTLQQHFTPRKIGKPPTATFLHPVPVLGSNSLPLEISSLQSELLQLHLLHEVSIGVSRRWELSAKRSLHKKFEEVASMYQVMLEQERAGQEQNNILSLLQWGADNSSAGLVEQIQVLSEPLHELPSLVESGGRLQCLAEDFEHWIIRVQETRSARQDPTRNKGGLGSLDGLGESWKTKTAAMTRKLTSFVRDLDSLNQPSPGSSIVCILNTCTLLLGGILDELHTMQMIEAEVVTREQGWVEDRLNAIARDVGSYTVDASGDSAAWRM